MSIEQLSNDCIKILEKKSFKKVVIAGHMGTRLAIDIASKIKYQRINSIDGSRFSNYETYFEVLSNFENSLNKVFQSVNKNVFIYVFF